MGDENGTTSVVRAATVDDVPGIMALVDEFVRRGDILPRTEASVRLSIHDWVVATLDDEVVGMGSLLFYSVLLAEVRSLAVAERAQGYGFGRKITTALLDMARDYRTPTVFALTRAVPFFERMGFTVTQKENFPEKIWRACQLCPIRDNCDEIAVVIQLGMGNGSADDAGATDRRG
jgi:amino-acid N-acetyltransferase